MALADLGSEKWDPRIDLGTSLVIASEVFEPLMGNDANGALDNSGLADHWTVAPDGKSVTFFLRQGVLWHDGVEFTADDVKYTLDTYYRADGTLSPAGAFVKANADSVKVVDKYTVTVQSKAQMAPILPGFGAVEGFVYIVPKHYLEAKGLGASSTQPIGTGPWKFSGQKPGEYVELEANTAYRDPARVPTFKTAHITGVKEPSTRAAMLRSGQVDIAQVDPVSLPTLAQAAVTIKPLRYSAETILFFLKSYDPTKLTNNVDFRKALNLAIDRNAILHAIYSTGSADVLKGGGLFAPGVLGDDPAEPAYPFDQVEARRLLATVYHGETVTLWSYTSGPNPEQLDVNELIQGYWTQVGLKVDLQRTEDATFRPRVDTQDFPRAVEIANFAPAIRPSMVSTLRTYLNGLKDNGVISVYQDQPKAKAWSDELTQMTDPKAIESRLLQINHEMYKEYWAVPLFLENTPYASSKATVGSWDPGALRRLNIRLWSAIRVGN